MLSWSMGSGTAPAPLGGMSAHPSHWSRCNQMSTPPDVHYRNSGSSATTTIRVQTRRRTVHWYISSSPWRLIVSKLYQNRSDADGGQNVVTLNHRLWVPEKERGEIYEYAKLQEIKQRRSCRTTCTIRSCEMNVNQTRQTLDYCTLDRSGIGEGFLSWQSVI